MSAERMIAGLVARWRQAGYPDFAWWIPLAMDGFAFMAGAIAVGQRHDQSAVIPAAVLILVALSPWFLDLFGWRVPWPLFLLVTLGTSSVMMVRYPVDYDFTMLMWVMLVGHLGATERLSRSLAATAIAAVALKIMGLSGLLASGASAFWLAGLLVGWDIGFIMQYQQRRLEEQERAHADHEAQAVLEERQRIAREVHDVIAHSLSVTMLHLTAARRNLEEDGSVDVDEAIDALRDAERLGRQAMSDIRQTVGLLGQAADRAVAPDLADIPALVAQFRSAGLEVDLDLRGDSARVPATTGLGLYRIVQESLANVAKHQPRSRVGVVLDVADDRQVVQVWNTLGAPVHEHAGGSGLTGMRQRAELLDGSFSAGPREGAWVVEVQIPARSAKTCRLGLPRLSRSAPAPDTATGTA